MSTRVTVLMPNYNNEEFLQDCLDSILCQTYKDFALLIVDDGSTDESFNILSRNGDPRITVLKNEKNLGIVDALNLGLKEIETEFIVRHDGDDLMREDRIEVLVNYMDAHPEIGICGSDVQYIGERDGQLIYPRNPVENKANLIFGHSIAHASCILRTQLLKDNGITYRGDYFQLEDYDLFYRLKDLTLTNSVPELLYLCRIWERNDPDALLEKRKLTFLKMYARILSDLSIEDKNAALVHFELCKNVAPSFRYKDYCKHIDLILEKNMEVKLFPHAQLVQRTEKVRTKMLYRLLDNQQLGMFEITANPSLWRYALSKKVRS